MECTISDTAIAIDKMGETKLTLFLFSVTVGKTSRIVRSTCIRGIDMGRLEV